MNKEKEKEDFLPDPLIDDFLPDPLIDDFLPDPLIEESRDRCTPPNKLRRKHNERCDENSSRLVRPATS